MTQTNPSYSAYDQAVEAYRSGDLPAARRWAMKAALHAPLQEMPWLLLSSLVDPRSGIEYLQRVLVDHPDSERARAGLDWLEKNHPKTETPAPAPVVEKITPEQGGNVWVQVLLRRIFSSLLILLGIAFLTQLGLYALELGQQALPVTAGNLFVESFNRLEQYLIAHPTTYLWGKQQIGALQLVRELVVNSLVLLVLSLVAAALVGVALGVVAALTRRKAAPLVLFVSLLGISLPSFLLAMLLLVADFSLTRFLGVRTAPLPPTGTGFDLHLVMPMLVLGARPLAQIVQVTYISMTQFMDEEFLRVVRAKGATRWVEVFRHILPNIAVPVLTTMGSSLRFSLASLPVVESFFLWNGVGLGILLAVERELPTLVTDLVVILGLFFLLINLVLEIVFPAVDPRLRSTGSIEEDDPARTMGSPLETVASGLRGLVERFFSGRRPPAAQEDPLKKLTLKKVSIEDPAEKPPRHRLIFNLWFVLGLVLVLGMGALMIFGGEMTTANPYVTHGVMKIEGAIKSPPFSPGVEFPWGTDPIGRDIRALVLAGARETLSLALIAALARVALGTLLGILAGWWQRSWLDKLVSSLISVWAAFPITIFTMIIILALGIQRGRDIFIIALCLVGWGEIAQYVRNQVVAQKPLLYIEAARSVGARAGEILVRYLIPYLTPALLVLTIMEIGGVLMLLAELGFLNIFLGGGFRAAIGEGAGMTAVVYYFSDIPEWSALLANVRNWWRSYPWMAWYPGLFFFLAIFGFNLFGEGLRRFLDESRINLSRLVNRWTILASAAALAVIMLLLRGATPLSIYSEQASTFDSARAMTHIERLSSPQMQGRTTGLRGGALAAEYIAEQMKDIGLFPSRVDGSYIHEYRSIYPLLTGMPAFSIEGLGEQKYRDDFMEYALNGACFGTMEGAVVGLTIGAGSDSSARSRYTVRDADLWDKAVIVLEEDIPYLNFQKVGGILVVPENPAMMQKRYLMPRDQFAENSIPAVYIREDLAEQLLESGGSSLEKLRQMRQELKPDEIRWTEPGIQVQLSVPGDYETITDHYRVVGVIPGTGASQNKAGMNGGLDSQVIIVSAYYDGLGVDPEGVLYPGANDNASGVAAMLEMARMLKSGLYPPEKTVIFIAWSGGEHAEGFSVTNTINDTTAFDAKNVEVVLELSGVGAGDGDALLLGEGSSYRLMKLFQKAAAQMGGQVTNRGRGVHTGIKTIAGFGERKGVSAFLSWEGSDRLAHTAQDTFEQIDQNKIDQTGKITGLVLSIIGREQEY